MRPLTEQEKSELLQGPAELRAKQAEDWEFVRQSVECDWRSALAAALRRRF